MFNFFKYFYKKLNLAFREVFLEIKIFKKYHFIIIIILLLSGIFSYFFVDFLSTFFY